MVVIFLLIGSVIAYGQPSSGANWLSPDGNTPLNWNYSPQDVITSKNVEELTLQWVIPIPAAFTRGENEGVGVTPLVVNGIVYYVTNWHRILALDSRGTKVVWFIDPPTSVLKEIGTGHYRQIMYTQETRGKPLVWVGPDNFHILAYAALTSDRELLLSATNQSEVLSGNYGVYGRYESHFIIDDHRGVLVAGGEGTGTTNAGRGFFRAFSLNDLTPRPLWTTFIVPPQDGSDSSWSARSVESMSHAWIFNGQSAVDLKGLPSNEINRVLGGDWGSFGFNGARSFAGGCRGGRTGTCAAAGCRGPRRSAPRPSAPA